MSNNADKIDWPVVVKNPQENVDQVISHSPTSSDVATQETLTLETAF